MPSDVDNYVLDRRSDYSSFAFGQRRVFYERKLDEWLFLTSSPISVKLLRHLDDVRWINVASQDKCRIIRHVVTLLDQPHHRSGCTGNGLPVSQRILSTCVFRKKSAVHCLV